jgi:hypothetical protein
LLIVPVFNLGLAIAVLNVPEKLWLGFRFFGVALAWLALAGWFECRWNLANFRR